MADCSTGDAPRFGHWTGTAGNTNGDYWNQPRGWAPVIYERKGPDPFTVHTVERVIERVIERPEEVKAMRGLFNVHIVDPDEGGVVASQLLLVAKSQEDAKLRALTEMLKAGADHLTKDLDDYDIIVVRLGDVRPKREVQEVKVVTD